MINLLKQHCTNIIQTNNTENFIDFVINNKFSSDVILLFYHANEEMIYQYYPEDKELHLNPKLKNLMTIIHTLKRKINSDIKNIKRIDGTARQWFNNFDPETIINIIENRISPLLKSFSKDLSFKLIDDKNQHIYINEIILRFGQLKQLFGIDFLQMNTTKPITYYDFEYLTIKEKMSYYEQFLKTLKILLESLISNLKTHILVKELISNFIKNKVTKKNIRLTIESIETFYMNINDKNIT